MPEEVVKWISVNDFLDTSFLTNIDFSNDPIADEIESYGKLPVGWDFGTGVPASDETINNAKNAYLQCYLSGFQVEAHPETDGSITLIAFIEDHFLDIEVNDSSIAILRYEVGEGKNFEVRWKNKKCLLSELKYILFEIKSECKQASSSGYSTQKNITAPEKRDSERIKYLNHLEGEYLYSVNLALTSSLEIPVITLQHITPQLEMFPIFSGKLT